MAVTTVSSREFNQDTSGAKKAAAKGPVFITDRGRAAHVLLTFEQYQKLAGAQTDLIETLGSPPGVEDVELEIPTRKEVARPADLR